MYFFYYLPVGIDVQSRRPPVATILLAMSCLVMFIAVRFFPNLLPVHISELIYYADYPSWMSALSAAFVHFGYFHLISNLIYLLLFGWYLEERLGSGLFVLLYLGAAVVGNWAQGVYNVYALHIPTMGIIGASGAVSGVMGAFLVRFPISNVRIAYWVFLALHGYNRAGRVQVPTIFAMALWVILQSARGLLQFEGASANVAHVTHLTGFIFGVSLAAVAGQWREGRHEAHLIRARRHLAKGEPYGAQGELQRYVEMNPHDADAHAQFARALLQTREDAQASKHYAKACELHLAQKNRSAAENLFQEALRGFPEFVLAPEPHLKLAFGLERNLKPELALRAYENFELWYSDHPETPFTLLRAAGLYSSSRFDDERAAKCYSRLIDKYPTDEWVDFAREQVRFLTS